MKIEITDTTRISTVQESFNKLFPFLKLEFFSKKHNAGTKGVKASIKPPSSTLGECRTVRVNGEINIVPLMTVKELELLFLQHYGLFAQVFRKSGNVWLETTVTDEWSLEQQNAQGEEMSKVGYWSKDKD